MRHYWIGKDCCHCTHLSVIYFITLTIQAVVIMQTIAFLLLNYLRGLRKQSFAKLSWFVSAISAVYSVQRIIPYLMLPHLFTSLISLFAAVLLVTLTTYHIIKGLRLNFSLMLLLLFPSLYSFGALYSIYLTLSCFRILIRKKNSVDNITQKADINSKSYVETLAEQETPTANTISYSRRPTVIISDDYLHMLHR
uniref:Uncharacterized protein n=1 Tax=Onchocerca volvulus TaxID=6282 RepID=A0A8R1XUQ7_ONCVO